MSRWPLLLDASAIISDEHQPTMGICLDTDQQSRSQVFDDGDSRSIGRWRGEAGLLVTPRAGQFPMQNAISVKFEQPKVPVIFVLGGPGSGKVTHCDNLVQEKEGITHINMTDLLQQYAIGNDMQDFSLLSSKTVAEVLMLEIKMSPEATTFLISGYPRNMRDVVEYSEKIQKVNGIILVSWRQEVLERQIDYGAQLGHVILGLARMELRNFYRNVMPVAEYFDRTGILLEINGERNPSEVYIDFREAVMRILEHSESNPEVLETEVEVERVEVAAKDEAVSPPPDDAALHLPRILPETPDDFRHRRKTGGNPRFIWVIGGPGSNKSHLCVQTIKSMPTWRHISIGGLLRTMALSNSDIKDAIESGEMVERDVVMQIVEQQVIINREADGIIIDGIPRDLSQARQFETRFGQEPPLVLLDCSKLQLGRGKLDDSVPAFRKRLEIFREITLPMLKHLDDRTRLTTIDGDTDISSVQKKFASVIHQLMGQVGHEVKNSVSSLGVQRLKSVARDSDTNKMLQANGRLPKAISNYNTAVENGRIISHQDEPSNSMEHKFKNGHLPALNGIEKLTNRNKQVIPMSNAIIANGVKRSNIAVGSFQQKQQQQDDHDELNYNKNAGVNGIHGVLKNGATQIGNNGLVNGTTKISVAPIDKTRDTFRNMYNEVKGYQGNLHI